MKSNRTIIAIVFFILCCKTSFAHVLINEIMQSNIDCIMDDINEFPDSWVELYNSGIEYVNLNEFKINDSDDPMSAYSLPNHIMAPGDFILVYCDKQNQGWHTDFRLDSGKGGSIYLFHNDDIEDMMVNLKKQPSPNVAYGRKTENSYIFGYQLVATPGYANCGEVSDYILKEPIFSVVGGIMGSGFELKLSVPDDSPEGTVIRYTLDGSEPTADSAIYDSPINISSTTAVRAKLFMEGWLSPRSATHSYIFHPRESNLPVVSIVSDEEYFYGDSIGIYVTGNYSSEKANFRYDWRRPINIEMFEASETPAVINQLCETRVKGNATREYPLKSLIVYANKRFGEKRFSYEFFPTLTPGIDEFKSIELRNGGNDFTGMFMRDAIIQQSVGMHCDLDWQPSQPVILYINGTYKGLMNIRPRSNEDYIYSYYDGLEDIDMLENWWELKAGSLDSYNSFMNFLKEDGHSFEDYDKQIETQEFCDLMIMNSFFNNRDFPDNNIVMWRPATDTGRWRWIAKDTDLGLGWNHSNPEYPTLNWYAILGFDGNDKRPYYYTRSLLFRNLMEIEEFQNMFIDRSSIYLGDFLHYDHINHQIDDRRDMLESEFKYHKDLYDPTGSSLNEEIDFAEDWVQKRWYYFFQHLAEFFGLENPVPLNLLNEHKEIITLSVNGIPLVSNEYKGMYFPSRWLTVSSSALSEDTKVLGWKVEKVNNDESYSQFFEGDTLSIVMPEADKVEISPVFSAELEKIEGINNDSSNSYLIYDIMGKLVYKTNIPSFQELPKGIYIIRNANSVYKIKI